MPNKQMPWQEVKTVLTLLGFKEIPVMSTAKLTIVWMMVKEDTIFVSYDASPTICYLYENYCGKREHHWWYTGSRLLERIAEELSDGA